MLLTGVPYTNTWLETVGATTIVTVKDILSLSTELIVCETKYVPDTNGVVEATTDGL